MLGSIYSLQVVTDSLLLILKSLGLAVIWKFVGRREPRCINRFLRIRRCQRDRSLSMELLLTLEQSSTSYGSQGDGTSGESSSRGLARDSEGAHSPESFDGVKLDL